MCQKLHENIVGVYERLQGNDLEVGSYPQRKDDAARTNRNQITALDSDRIGGIIFELIEMKETR